MNSIKFLYAAYIITAVIHIAYIGSMVRRYQAIRQRQKNLVKGRN